MTPTPPGAPQRIRNVIVAVGIAAAATLAGCAPGTRGHDGFNVREITPGFLLPPAAMAPAAETPRAQTVVPAGEPATHAVRDPALAADAYGTIALVWVTNDATRADLWLSISRDSGARFTPPTRVNTTAGDVVSSPEGRPAVALGPGGALGVAWSERRADSTGAVDLRVRASADFGRTLGDVATVNDDTAPAPPGMRWRQRLDWALAHRPDSFHGYAALAFTTDGALLVTWLDDRRAPAPEPARRATLWHSISTDGGRSWSANAAVSDSASPRCRAALAIAGDGAVALGYRDDANGLRDLRLALSFDGGQVFTTDTLVSRERGVLADGPVQGPALVWDRPDGGHCVWHTAAPPAGVYIARWRRAGGVAGLSRPVTDSLANAAHPLATALGDLVLIGVEAPVAEASTRHALAVRSLDPAGTWSPWTMLGADATSGALVSAGTQRAVACWVEREAGSSRLRIATLTRRRGPRG